MADFWVLQLKQVVSPKFLLWGPFSKTKRRALPRSEVRSGSIRCQVSANPHCCSHSLLIATPASRSSRLHRRLFPV